jgi:predicted phosphodiesterase
VRVLVYSDLHLEFGPLDPPSAAADVVVLAGDIALDLDALPWAREKFGDRPIVYVFGNHEFYQGEVTALLDRARRESSKLDIHFLECDAVTIEGVRFLGTTLWTDFEVDAPQRQTADEALALAQRAMSDFGLIRYRDGMLTARQTREFHRQARAWLQAQLARPFDGKTVVVTHHLPHVNSVDRLYRDHPLNPAFVSHMPELVRAPVDLWIHGHTHCSCDYRAAATRVVCNPRGYYPHDLNAEFDPLFVVEV